MVTSRRVVASSLIVLAAIAAGACSRARPFEAESPTARDAAAHDGPLIISAAASTQELLDSLVEKFLAKTGTAARINPGPSSGLASQIIAGAPADLFLSANQQWADEVQKQGKVAAQVKLLTNRLVLVVPDDNPGAVQTPPDLLAPHVTKIALAGEQAPAGQYADQALSRLKLLEPLVAAGKIARGQDVRSALGYVERGEAEAGIVYATDVAAATGLKVVHSFDSTLHDEIVYVLVLLQRGHHDPRAQALFDFLQAPETDATYAEFGFTRLR